MLGPPARAEMRFRGRGVALSRVATPSPLAAPVGREGPSIGFR